MKYILRLFKFQRNTLLIMTAIAVAWYAVWILHLGGIGFVRKSFYFTVDSNEYREYAQWLSGKWDYCNPLRTFCYPLVILLSGGTVSVLCTWFVQFLMWLVAVLFVSDAVLRMTSRSGIAVISFLLMLTQLSLIVYTAHGLTEIFVFFLLACIVHLISRWKEERIRQRRWWNLLLLFSLLATAKPLYQPLWYLAALICTWQLISSIRTRPVVAFLLLFALSPFIAQKAIAYKTTHSFSTTGIADFNMKYYFYRKVKFFEDHKDLPDPERVYNYLPDSIHNLEKHKLDSMPHETYVSYLTSHPATVGRVFLIDLNEDLCAGNPYISDSEFHGMYKWVANTNGNIFRLLHLAFFPFFAFVILRYFKQRRTLYYLFVLSTGILLYYSFASAGITYWAGDRLTVSSSALWLVLYPALIFFPRTISTTKAK